MTKLPEKITDAVNNICNLINSNTSAHFNYGNTILSITNGVDRLTYAIKQTPSDVVLPDLINDVEECITLSISESLARRNGYGKFFSAYWIVAKYINNIDNSLDVILYNKTFTPATTMELVWCMSLLERCYIDANGAVGFDNSKQQFIKILNYICSTYTGGQLTELINLVRLSVYPLTSKLVVTTIINTHIQKLSVGGVPEIVNIVDNVDWVNKTEKYRELDKDIISEIHKSIESCESQLKHLKDLLAKLVS